MGRDIMKETERNRHRGETKDQDTVGEKEERKEGIYRGDTMESNRAEKSRREMEEYRGKRQRK